MEVTAYLSRSSSYVAKIDSLRRIVIILDGKLIAIGDTGTQRCIGC